MLNDQAVELIATMIGDAETFGCDPVDTVEAIAFHLGELGFGNGEAERIARDAVGVSMH